MSATKSPSEDRFYPVALVCKAWGIPRSVCYEALARRRDAAPPAKPGPRPLVSDCELAELIRGLLDATEREFGFRGEGSRKLHARLRHAGVAAHKDRVLRVMRENGLLSPSRVGTPRGPRNHDGVITTTRPDVMWGTDATTVATLAEGTAWVFIAVDHCTGECLGIHASPCGNRFEAFEPIRQAIRSSFGTLDNAVAAGVSVRHDNGTQYMSRFFQAELRFYGIASSPSYVRAPEGNGVAERFIRTPKEQLLWVQNFRTIEELRLALHDFADRYNNAWLLARHGYRTPAAVRAQFAA